MKTRFNNLCIAAAAALAIPTAAAQASTFVGSYDLDYNDSDPGLVLEYLDLTPGAGTGFTFDLNSIGEMAIVPLGDLWTNEEYVGGDDWIPKPIEVTFNFTQPGVGSGGVGGVTGGISVFGVYEYGYVRWANNGNFVASCGFACVLAGKMSNGEFNNGYGGLNEGYPGHTKLVAQFWANELPPPTGAIPEPGTWALMILGFGGAGAALRAHRRQHLLTA